MNAWFTQLNRLIARRESGELTEEAFQDYKKRLQILHTNVNEFDKKVEEARKRFADDDTFQMQILELQIEDEAWELEDREAFLLQWKSDLEAAIEKALLRNVVQNTETETLVSSVLTTEQKASLQKETQTLVSGLREKIHVLRSERLDPEIWIHCNQIEDALYRNGSEDVEVWNRRVLKQQHILLSL